MPVGNSDKGVGLWAGQIMVGTDINYQYIDWAHPKIVDEMDGNDEVGEHLGTLTAHVVNPSITIGLSDYWNATFSQVIGKRQMTWENDKESVHHREEGSDSDFKNAIGGLLGDSRIMFRYLAINAGAGVGNRLFFGGGLVIPSENTLTNNPFSLNEEDVPEPHRHFSMSEGVYKGVFEAQYFIKRTANPVFVGGIFSIEEPLGESEHGFKASRMIDLSFTAFTKKINLINGSMGGSLMFRHTSEGYWNGEQAPNSESFLVAPGVGLLLNAKVGVLALNIQKPYFIEGSVSGGNSASKEKTDVWQMTVSFRRILDYSIPWLYW